MTHIIRRIEQTFGYVGADDEMTLLNSYSEYVDMIPDAIDVEDGLSNPVLKAIDYFKHSAYVVEASVCPYDYARRGTWLSAETYQNPYSADIEEVSYHFEGDWTDDEIRHIVTTVLGK